MKVSVVTWDASFRENLHTIDAFGPQTGVDVEFIWVDFYDVSELIKEQLSNYQNCRYLGLGNDPGDSWHLGKCINSGVLASTGDILIIPDGDIVVGKEFITKVVDEMKRYNDIALYFRRYDEPSKTINDESSFTFENLSERCVLTNPTNYAGCLVLHRALFDRINGFEEHWAFSGPGINGIETNTRLRNCGALIKWCEEKIFHPWHEATGSSATTQEDKRELAIKSTQYHWILPYAGIAQSWIVRQRALSLSSQSSAGECDVILKKLPQELSRYAQKYY